MWSEGVMVLPLLGDVKISHVVETVVDKQLDLFFTEVILDTLRRGGTRERWRGQRRS